MNLLHAFGLAMGAVGIHVTTQHHVDAISALHGDCAVQLKLGPPLRATKGASQLFAVEDQPTLISLDPKPLTPRPITGTEIRVPPPAHIQTSADLQAVLAWTRRAYMAEQNWRRPS